ncbi:Uncharacterised protein [Zhongshania aliphaticivorans]|uniref:DUF3703 domain-containing protein n=1 Tax=Zhongshania aliphaticivorans TaxID=1470434 RepID=A0A5S9MZ10_9GAMM|nr:DUF3703 domain-containing protein [Zhongshania aliphaticivorans]CAA0080852.1 Uncharacterised protein [Zhongshania aliphaticivorans]CAA0085306.1 Uncharacterised protein [Zhongshania aliphaticivorans]
MRKFTKNIAPHVNKELGLALKARHRRDTAKEFTHLENAHVLGQESTYQHTKVHCLMLMWGIRQGDFREIFGQVFRIIGAATKTSLGLVPSGNTGGSNISPFATRPISSSHAQAIINAKKTR